ncbi:MAG: GntR family transcriptional regulator, partial [Acidimicrobiales bacterium]
MRRIRYIEIADVMRQRIVEGEYAAGQVLESESDLSSSFEASRVTIRRALEELRHEGLVDSRQGFGWFVAADPLRQSLAQLGTIEQQLSDSGLTAERRILDFAFVRATPHVAEILGTDEVLQVRRMNNANGRPFARVTVWCPAELAGELSRADVEREPFVRLLDVELGGAHQTIAAALVEPDDAELL